MISETNVNLIEVAEIIMGQSPPSTDYNSEQMGIPFYQGVSDFGEFYPTPRIYCDKPKRIANEGDILFSVRAPIGRLNIANEKCATGRGIAIIRPKQKSDFDFIWYSLKSSSNYWDTLEGSGSVFSNAKKTDLENLSISWPSEIKRKLVGSSLRVIDDNIRNRTDSCDSIKYLSESLFKSWFIDFSPVKAKAMGRQPFGMDEETAALFPDSFENSSLGPIPEDWKVGKMKDTTKVIGGGTPSTKNPDYWDGNICWTSPKDLSDIKGLIIYDTAKKITEKGLSKVSSGLLPSNTVLMSSRAPIGYLALTRIPMAINQGYIAFGQNEIFGPSYLLNWCKFNLPVIEAYSGGSVFPEISKSNFKEIRCVIPRVEILEIFETICQPLFDQLEANARTIKSLEDTRDALLPRLMSGELSVEGLEV